MNVTFMAKNALAAYLASSAEFGADEYDRRIAQRQRLIKTPHHFAAARILAADQHPVGMGKVADGRALTQEFRIGADHDVESGLSSRKLPLDLAAGADRHRRFGGDDRRDRRDAAPFRPPPRTYR